MEVVVQAVTAVIALAALAVSIVVARRQTAVQERLAAIEEARRADEVTARGRAWVTASIKPSNRDVRIQGPRLLLRNEGPAVARRALVTVVKRSRTAMPLGLEALPVDLQPGQEMEFGIPFSLGEEPRLELKVQWIDQLGGHSERWALKVV